MLKYAIFLIVLYSVCDGYDLRLSNVSNDYQNIRRERNTDLESPTIQKNSVPNENINQNNKVISDSDKKAKTPSNENAVSEIKNVDASEEKPKQMGNKTQITTKPLNKDTKTETHEIPNANSHANKPEGAYSLNSDALLRGFYVFVGLGTLVMIYIVFKALGVRKPPAPTSLVRKYGVTARRSDLEMLPLPLAEEEDDDTLFEVGVHRPIYIPNNIFLKREANPVHQ